MPLPPQPQLETSRGQGIDALDVEKNNPERLPSHVVDPTVAHRAKSNWNSNLHAAGGVIFDTPEGSSDASISLRSVAKRLSDVLKLPDKGMVNRKAVELLIPRIETLAKSLERPVPESDVEEISRRKTLKRELERGLQCLDPSVVWVRKVPGLFEDVKNAETSVEDIRDAVMDYQTALQQDIIIKVNQLIEAADRSLLNGMHRAKDAGYLSGNRQGCLKGTREGVLLQIERWSMEETSQPVFWLDGSAGTGKTAIAQTFAERSFADGKLGASFFCSRDFEHRSDLRTIFPTLAFQLAYRYPLFRERLLHVLRANPDIGRESLSSQIEKAIVRPLQETRISTLIIIDALDECRDEEPASAILFVLSRFIHHIPEVKFFITARPEPRIRSGFRLELLHPVTEIFKLHDVDRASVDEDIRLYLRTQLNNIRKTRRNCEFPEEWPFSYDINILCRKAAGLFVHASTVVKFVAYKLGLPTERLALILRSRGADGEEGMDSLYTKILELAFPDRYPDEEFFTRLRHVIGTALLAFHSISVESLSELTGGDKASPPVRRVLRSLHSLFSVPTNDNDPIGVPSGSFSDFLTNRERCRDQRFVIDAPVHHERILFSCHDIMSERLRQNICDLDDYALLSEVEDLSDRLKYVGSTLEYACRFWTKHLAKAPHDGPHVGQILKTIDEFFKRHLLCWIEVLCIAGHLRVAVYAMNDIRQWYISAGTTTKYVDDVERLILEHFDVINDSPSHIYHSALPLFPSSSWLRECYEGEITGETRVLMGLSNKGSTCSRTISVERPPSAFAYWEDIIAVGSEFEVLLLDAITGGVTFILSGHTDTISSLVFSLDGTLLVSGSDDKTVNLWDVRTTEVVKTFSNHTSPITSVSISRDNTTVASGTWDGTIRLWDVRSGVYHPLSMRHDYEVTAINFSPTNSWHLISSSTDKTVRQWNVDGNQVETRVHNEAAAVVHVTYSSDGTQFVSCGGTAATVRDTETGSSLVTLDTPSRELQLRYCCFSSDGRFVACAAGATIYVWDIADLRAQLIAKLDGHSKNIVSMVFSFSLTSGSEDRSVKIWRGGTFLSGSTTAADMPAPVDSAPIESVKLFAEDSTVVTSDSSGLVRTWDLVTGKYKSSFSTPAEGIRDTHLAGDTLIIVWWASGDREYHIWDVRKEQILRKVPSSLDGFMDLKISGDGTKIFGLGDRTIEVRSVQTGEHVGRVRREGNGGGEGTLVVDGSRVWLEGSLDMGWDFGDGEASVTTLLPRETLGRLRLASTDRSGRHSAQSAWIEDTVKGRRVFHLPERYMTPDTKRRCDGRYLVVWSPSGEVIVMDFGCLL